VAAGIGYYYSKILEASARIISLPTGVSIYSHDGDGDNELPPTPFKEIVFRPGPDKFLGTGRFGQVLFATWKEKEVAVKIVSIRDEPGAIRESEIYKLLQAEPHPNILKFYFANLQQRWIVLGYHSGGSLQKYLEAQTISQIQLRQFGLGIANGLSFLHDESITASVSIMFRHYILFHFHPVSPC